MRLHYLQHVPFEGLGSMEAWAARHEHSVSVTRFYIGDPLPSLDSFESLVILGGPMNVYEEIKYPWLADEKRFIGAAIENGRCVLGICLGAQLIADVLGAKIYRNAHREIGWFPVFRTDSSSQSRLPCFLPDTMETFHWHGDTFDMPSGAVHLARSEACENQAFSYGKRIVGLQFHLETTRSNAESLIEYCSGDMADGPFVQTPGQMLSDKAPFAEINVLMDSLLNMLFNTPS